MRRFRHAHRSTVRERSRTGHHAGNPCTVDWIRTQYRSDATASRVFCKRSNTCVVAPGTTRSRSATTPLVISPSKPSSAEVSSSPRTYAGVALEMHHSGLHCEVSNRDGDRSALQYFAQGCVPVHTELWTQLRATQPQMGEFVCIKTPLFEYKENAPHECGASDVSRDGFEPPTRGFSVPALPTELPDKGIGRDIAVS